MDSDEPYLRPCKQLPSPTNDRQIPHSPMGQHLGMQSTHVQIDQNSRESSQEPSTTLEDNEEDLLQSDTDSGLEIAEHAICETNQKRMTRLLKGKDKEWESRAKRKGPLRLLDLPLDVLKIVLKEVTHTNDLANCAKVNSALHSIVTPMIYSRFDIVWPDTLNSAEPRAGVDALTYGLATLVMREDLFENILHPDPTSCGAACQSLSCSHCGLVTYLSQSAKNTSQPRRLRRGNYFSQFVRKFSLGNGPPDWVQEYLVTKESGKMLGTLVALSVARMPNLESFIWDMPTGVLRDIWIALSSLGDHRPSRLEKLWIRFHDNQAAVNDAELEQTGQASQTTSGPAAAIPSSQQASLTNPERYGVSKVVWIDHLLESPNFSIMPALRSLTVLDIDEVRYLVELSTLLRRSLGTLRELRLGMAPTLCIPPSAQNDVDVAPLFSGGVLALLMSKICDHPRAVGSTILVPPTPNTSTEEVSKKTNDMTSQGPIHGVFGPAVPLISTDSANVPAAEIAGSLMDESGSGSVRTTLEAIDPALFDERADFGTQGPNLEPETEGEGAFQIGESEVNKLPGEMELLNIGAVGNVADFNTPLPADRLKLEILELERLTRLSASVLRKTIDFTVLTSLTLLRCGDQSGLWDRLRREFAPRKSRINSIPEQTMQLDSHGTHPRRKVLKATSSDDLEYQLRLKKIHTDAVSSELISFLKLTLAPNTLEFMFLQDNLIAPSPVTLEAIYRGPLRRHRASLTKVMIDSAYGAANSRSRSETARKWTLNRDILAFITSSKMNKLRELALAIEYKDWHYFLQRLPNVPHLRSLYVPTVAGHPYGASLNVKDFALGAIDVVALRPEVELCYLGIKNKCFEILERKQKTTSKGQSSPSHGEDSDDDTQDGDHNDDEEDSEDGEAAPAPAALEPGAMDSDTGSLSSDNEGDGEDSATKKKVRLKLREILFYDDKISIFKARHGRL